MKGLSRIWSLCKKQSKRLNVSPLLILLDFVTTKVLYGFNWLDYFNNTNGFANKSTFKKRVFQYHHRVKLSKDLNDKSALHLLDDKTEFLKHFSSIIKRGWIAPAKISYPDFEKFITHELNEKGNALICKPINGECGQGISIFKPSSDLKKDYDKLVKDGIFLEGVVKQDNRMIFNNKSLNTIRVYSLIDTNGNTHILKAILRVGVGDTLTDNYHTGGVIYPLNVEKGFIESFGKRMKSEDDIYIHPHTDNLMLGFQVPFWDEVVATVKKATSLIPNIRYVGWDIAISQNGVDIIEGNSNADHALFERIGIEKFFWPKIKKLAYGK